nr:response regulator [Desulfobacterales bacterium]
MGIFDESYSSVELARILGVHRVTVTSWIKKGALKAAKTPGGRYKVSKDDLKTFLRERGMSIPSFLQVEERKLVVAVDDEEMVLETLERFFSTQDMLYPYRLRTFINPLDAALFIGDQKPDLVLLDLLMPEVDGFDLAQKIKQVSPNTQIIVMTGYATKENTVCLNNYGIDGILTKPFDFKTLKKIIENVLMIG